MSERSERAERSETAKSTALRITNQFRSNGGMAYDLKCDGIRLTLLIVERSRPDDPGGWRIEARGSSQLDQKAVVTEWGTTREEALKGVARTWAETNDTMGLRVFDWEAVAKTLRDVRAL